MCGGPDVEAEAEYLEALVMAAFGGYKKFVRTISGMEDETDIDWIKEFLDGVGNKLRVLEREGRLSCPTALQVTRVERVKE
jgi:hypothetical protein